MKYLILSILLCLNVSLSFGQRPSRDYDQDKLESARVAFFTNRLDLKASQAEKFWPIYNQHNEKRTDLMNKLSSTNREAMSDISDSRAKELIEQRLSYQQQLLDLDKKLMTDVSSVLSPTQAARLGGLNREFTRQVYRMQQGRGGRGNDKN